MPRKKGSRKANRRVRRNTSGKNRKKLTIGAVAKSGLNKVEKKEVKLIIKERKETRYCGRNFKYDDYAPAQVGGYLQPSRAAPQTLPGVSDVGANACTCLGFQTGEYLNTESTDINTNVGAGTVAPLGGYGMTQGTDSDQITGDYAYLQSAKLDLQITAAPWNTSDCGTYAAAASGLQFRVLHLTAKQIQSGIVPSYTNGMFWNRAHEKIGLTMVGTVKEIMDDFHINTDQFTVHKDIKFRLTQPQNPCSNDTWPAPTAPGAFIGPVAFALQGQGTNPCYPCQRNVQLWMPKSKKKIRFSDTDDTTTNAFEPTNYQYVNVILILCVRTNQQAFLPDLLSTDRCWAVKAAMETRFKDA